MTRKYYLNPEEIHEIERQIEYFFKSEKLPTNALEKGRGRFLFLTYRAWRIKAPQRNSVGHTFQNLHRWVTTGESAGIQLLPSLSHKLKGRVAFTKAEVRAVLQVMFLNWTVNDGKSVSYQNLSPTKIKKASTLLTEELLEASAELMMADGLDQVISYKKLPIYFLDEESLVGKNVEALLQAAAREEEITLHVTDTFGVMKGILKVVPVSIGGQSSVSQLHQLPEANILYIVAIAKVGDGKKLLVLHRF